MVHVGELLDGAPEEAAVPGWLTGWLAGLTLVCTNRD